MSPAELIISDTVVSMASDLNTTDILVVGAGISGISAACHLARALPHKRYTILERRERLGGTWDFEPAALARSGHNMTR